MTRDEFDALTVVLTPPVGTTAGYPFMPEDDGAIARIASELAWRGLVPTARAEVEGLAVIYGAVA